MAFDIDHFLPVSWNEYFRLVNKLADEIISSKQKYDRIIGITRAGLTLGHFLSDALSLPVSVFTIKSYVNIEKQENVEITEKLSVSLKGHNVLLVDEVSDTGKTFLKAIPYLKTRKPKNITTASIFLKPHSKFIPNFHVEETSKWILFPYEFTENAILLKRIIEKEGKEVVPNLLKLGYDEEGIKLLKKRGVI